MLPSSPTQNSLGPPEDGSTKLFLTGWNVVEVFLSVSYLSAPSVFSSRNCQTSGKPRSRPLNSQQQEGCNPERPPL